MRFNTRNFSVVTLFILSCLSVNAMAQLPAPNASGISTGHAHFIVPDTEKYLAIFEALGGVRGNSGTLAWVSFPGIYVLFREGQAEAPAIETVANHIGFTVNDYALYKGKLEAAGATFFYDDPNAGQILADLPDGIRIEIALEKDQSDAIRFHHFHLATTADLEELRSWYLKVLGAEAGERRGLPSAVMPGGRVDIMAARGDAPRTSRGAAFDHIGFEVADMDAFAEHMADLGITFDVEPRYVEAIGLTIAFITDPAGTYIEITEGFAGQR